MAENELNPMALRGGRASKLVKDLDNIPSIIGALGLSIAEAQKAFNLDYIENIERIVAIAASIGKGMGDTAEGSVDEDVRKFVLELLRQLAPPQYQFTETTLSVKMDLAQTMQAGAGAGFSVGYGAFAVNGAVSMAYGSDYRAAAEVKTVIHAVPSDAATLGALLGRAKELNDRALELPDGAEVDKRLVDNTHELVKKLTSSEPTALVAPAEAGDDDS